MIRLLKLNLTSKLIIISSFLLYLINPTTKAEEISIEYNPPSEEKTEEVDQNRTVGSGSRSNCQSLFKRNSLTLLIPEAEIAHQTVSSNPTLYFYARETSKVPLTVNLVIPEPKIDNPIFTRTITIERPGIQQIQVPSSVKLEYHKIYLWQLGIPCRNNTAKLNQILIGAIKRISPSEELVYRLKKVDNPFLKSKVYAEHGIWYDALDWAQNKKNRAYISKYASLLLKNARISLKLN